MTMGFIAAGVAVAGIAGGAANGIIGANAAKGAAAAQQGAANSAEGELQTGYNTVASLEGPASSLGYGAEDILGSLYGINTGAGATPQSSMAGNAPGAGPTAIGGAGNASAATTPGATTTGNANYASFYNSPGYQYALSQAAKTTNAAAAAGGNLFSTNTLNAVNTNVEGVAAGQYSNYVNQLTSMAQLGQSAVGQTAQAASSTAANEANVTTGAGAAQAAGITGAAGAVSGGINTALQASTAAGSLYGVGLNPNSSGVNGANSPLNSANTPLLTQPLTYTPSYNPNITGLPNP
jgi:hypothetical protein